MTDLNALIAQRKALDAQIAAHKMESVARVCALMVELDVTGADLGIALRPAPAAPAPNNMVGKKRAVKFRDPATGSTWTGVGQRPRWMQARLAGGASLEQYLIK